MSKKLFALFFLMFLLTGCMENTITPTEKEGTSVQDETLPAETGDVTAPATDTVTEPAATEPATGETVTPTAPATGETDTTTAPADDTASGVSVPAADTTAPATTPSAETETTAPAAGN